MVQRPVLVFNPEKMRERLPYGFRNPQFVDPASVSDGQKTDNSKVVSVIGI